PANILLDGERVKLADFGIARVAGATRQTAHGHTVGTPNYLSPEQAAGEPVGPASDVYSLGLVLIECLTRAMAFPGRGVEAASARLQRDATVPDGFGSEWSALLARMTARDPGHRPAAAEVAVRLAASRASGAGTAVLAAPNATAVLPVRRSRRMLPWL